MLYYRMDSETHRVVTEYAFMLLTVEASSAQEPLFINQVPSEYIEQVVSMATELDRVVRRRRAHHLSSPWNIFEQLRRVRHEVVKGKLTSYSASLLGEALHSLQDACTPPSRLRKLHDRVEGEARKLQSALHQVHVELPKPVGRNALWQTLSQLDYGVSGSEALGCAVAYTFAALYAVFAPREAPDHLLAEAKKLRDAFAGWRLALYLILAFAAIALYTFITLAALALSLFTGGLLLAALFPLFFLQAFKAFGTLTRDLDKFLRNLHTATNLAYAAIFANIFIVLPASFLATPPPANLATAFLASANTLPYIALAKIPSRKKSYKVVEKELDWFIWREPGRSPRAETPQARAPLPEKAAVRAGAKDTERGEHAPSPSSLERAAEGSGLQERAEPFLYEAKVYINNQVLIPAEMVRALRLQNARIACITLEYKGAEIVFNAELLRTRHTDSRQFTIPKSVRDKYGIAPGAWVKVKKIEAVR
jgi:bifunctional DNA-binding transcriptional regulator/antitoxin component of YhaV-PrlF toxin-antitoxin module